MNQINSRVWLILLLSCFFIDLNVAAQEPFNPDTVQSGQFDMGKMWTFDYPPVTYFKNTYHFTPDEKWFDDARLSALRFADYCSASFVSPNGLIMTNHHCARESGTALQRPGEDFNKNGFYAKKLSDERKVPGLYVDQLQKIKDITVQVRDLMAKDTARDDKITARNKAFQKIISEYQNQTDWKGLVLQPIQFYNDGKFSLYGFKRYHDVRLVFMPELNIGFFGGNYDNFTYPRYDLDCSFFRVYDDQGKPLRTTHYFKFNPTGPVANEPVFVIGNPGSTRRLSTMSDLEFNRDVSAPLILTYLKDRSQALQAFNDKAKKDNLINEIFILENSYKARKGELEGLRDPYLMARKAAFEKKFKAAVLANPKLANNSSLWDSIRNEDKLAARLFNGNFFFTPNTRLAGNLLAFAEGLKVYSILERTDPSRAEMIKSRISGFDPYQYPELEESFLSVYLSEAKKYLGADDPFVKSALNGKTPQQAAHELITTSQLNDTSVRNKLLSKDTAYINHFKDPLLQLAGLAAPRYVKASEAFRKVEEALYANRNTLGQLLFDLYGTRIPPDATFSLRISDGIVKGYDYNGTRAPSHTTFFGMYDRYYSFQKQYPWSLPEKWQKPPTALLPIPLDFVSTNDIIGGNSGSPMINKNLEIIGLVFDGNIESLPGGFIYMPELNRAVGVTSAGMLGALRYIYKAKRLLKELTSN